MTPRDMQAAAEGHGRRQRTRFVYMARAFGQDIPERKARQIIKGRLVGKPASFEEHEKNLQKLADKHGWEI